MPGTPARKKNVTEPTYQSAAALVSRAAGPLASHLGAFVSSLIGQQYSASVIYIKAEHALAFDRWLAKRGLALADLSELRIERYQHRIERRHERICGETWRRERNHVTQLLRLLRDHGVCPAAHIETTAADDLVAHYRQHLQNHRGLAATTIRRYGTVAGQFLHERFGHGVVDLRAQGAGDVIEFVQRQTKFLQSAVAQGRRYWAVLLPALRAVSR